MSELSELLARFEPHLIPQIPLAARESRESEENEFASNLEVAGKISLSETGLESASYSQTCKKMSASSIERLNEFDSPKSTFC